MKAILTAILLLIPSVSRAEFESCEQNLLVSSEWRQSENVILIIQKLAPKFTDMSPRNLMDHEEQFRREMLRLTGRSIGPKVLTAAGAKIFGTWLKALEAAEIASLEPTKRRLLMEWSRDKIIVALQVLSLNFPDMNRVTLLEHDDQVREILFRKFERAAGTNGLHHAVKKEFGSWIKGVESAGISTLKIVSFTEKIDWSAEKLTEVLLKLKKKGISMHRKTFLNQTFLVREAMLREFKVTVNSQTIVDKAEELFGDWLSAVETADASYAAELRMHSRNEWSRDRIVEVLRFLKTQYRDMNLAKLRLEGAWIEEILMKKFDRRITLDALRKAAYVAIPGGWPGALKAAGIKTHNIRRREAAIEWNEELLTDVLYYLAKRGMSMQLSNFLQKQDLVHRLTLKHYSRPISTYSIYLASLEFFGGWRKALEASGVEVKKENLPSDIDNTPILPLVRNWETDSNGKSRRVVHIGRPPATPQEELETAETERLVAGSMENLDPENRLLVSLMLDYLNENEGLADKRKVLAFLHEKSDREYAWKDVESVLEVLAGDLAPAE